MRNRLPHRALIVQSFVPVDSEYTPLRDLLFVVVSLTLTALLALLCFGSMRRVTVPDWAVYVSVTFFLTATVRAIARGFNHHLGDDA